MNSVGRRVPVGCMAAGHRSGARPAPDSHLTGTRRPTEFTRMIEFTRSGSGNRQNERNETYMTGKLDATLYALTVTEDIEIPQLRLFCFYFQQFANCSCYFLQLSGTLYRVSITLDEERDVFKYYSFVITARIPFAGLFITHQKQI